MVIIVIACNVVNSNALCLEYVQGEIKKNVDAFITSMTKVSDLSMKIVKTQLMMI